MAMNDFEAPIFDALADALGELYDGITVVSADKPGTPEFPTVQLIMTEAVPDERAAESGDMEPRTICTFEAQAYSNVNRRQAKAIAKSCDELMASWGWRRTTFERVPPADKTIERYVVRWRGSVDADGRVAR